MNWCQRHWDLLLQAVKDRGLDGFGAQTGKELTEEIQSELEGDKERFDPVFGCWNRINMYMMESLRNQDRGGEILLLKCPLCILEEDGQPHLVGNWINGCVNNAYHYAVETGILKPN